jgi:regulator of PEP synthase PpsR (kinase-PPPase family)
MVISDSTGNLARHILSAVTTQFTPGVLRFRYENFVRTEPQLKALVAEAKTLRCVICHAMVAAPLKKLITNFCSRAKLPCCDLTGGLAKFIEESTGVKHSGDVDALHRLDDAYRQRISAMEFTLAHDDGLGLGSLTDADIVLVGVSRTSKTPTSILLAQMGYRTANVSLARNVEPPAELQKCNPRKVVGLLVNPAQLTAIRARRQSAWNMADTSYGDRDAVAEEVEWSKKFFRKSGWPVLDVTDQAVEETAAKVAQLIGPPPLRESVIELPSDEVWAEKTISRL